MLHYLCGLTGGSDDGRCPFRVGCRLDKFLRPSFHLGAEADRPLDVIAGQWELAVWTVANYCALFSDDVSSVGGEVHVACPTCGRLIPFSSEVVEGSGIVFCRASHCLGADKPVRILKSIAETTFNEVINAARRLAGGVRGYPILLDLDVMLQAPVLHCTGTIAKRVVLYVLACLPERLRVIAKRILLAIMGKGKITGLYLREFRELVALLVASPDLLGCKLDPVFVLLLQLVQLLNASWRSALTDATAPERNGAAAIMELTAFLIGPLYEEIKPVDPETKNSKVLNLYLHAPIAHVRAQVGAARQDVAYVSDDNIEGHIRGIGRYLYNHANNASQAELFCNMAAMRKANLGFSTPRSHPSSMVYTKHILVCTCWKTLGRDGLADFNAIRKLATDDFDLSLEEDTDTNCLRITLPLHNKVDENGAPRRDANNNKVLGKKEAVRRGLRARQHQLRLCICGKLGKELRSHVVEFAATQRVSKALALSRAASKAARAVAKAAKATATATVLAMERAAAAEAANVTPVAAPVTDSGAEVGAMTDLAVEDDAGVAVATTERSQALDDARDGYTVFSREHDQTHRTAQLVRAAELREYRERLDLQIQEQGLNVRQLARRLKLVLAEPVHDGWEGGEEEGRIDGSRLAQLIASPTERRLFKADRIEPVANCALSFLIDCSGSMKTHSNAVAMLVDLMSRALEQAGVTNEILGFTTGAWNGGRARKDWERARKPQHPGRLNERWHLILKDADQSWRRARPAIAALLKADMFREGIDGEAVDWACQRLNDRDEKRRILIVISDGCPMDSATQLANDDTYLDQHLMQIVQKHEEQGTVQIFGIGVGLDLSVFYSRCQAIDLTQGLRHEVFGELIELISGHRRR